MTIHIRLCLAGLVLALFSVGDAAGHDDAAGLQGKWKVRTAKNNGRDIFEGQRDKMFVIINKGEMRVVIEGTKSEQAAAFHLDAKTTPKQIEFTKQTRDAEWEGFSGQGGTGFEHLPYKLFQSWKLEEKTLDAIPAADKVLGIYELKDDRLKICWRTTKGRNVSSEEPTIRPDRFESNVYYHEILFELEKVKPEK